MSELPTRLLPTNIRRTETDITHWFHEATRGVTAEMAQHPDYWANVARKFKVNDRIEVVAQDGTFDLDLRVVAVDARYLWAQVRALRVFETKEPVERDDADPDGYRIEFAGAHKFRIIDRIGNVVEKYIPTREAAHERLAALKAEKAGERNLAA